jgi:transcriptional regulator with XRE-family HTH domain
MTMNRREQDDRLVERQIGGNVRRRRAVLDISRAELARRAELSYSEVSAVERGEREPLASTLLKITSALEFTLSDLYAGVSWVTPAEDGGNGHIEVDRRGRR